jgi:uncharacterized damage-inducible protein DinB
MTTVQRFLKQLEQESITTRKMLAIVPADKFGWQPHPRSMALGQLATHLAEVAGWVEITLTTDGLDLANNPFTPPAINNLAELLDFFEARLAKGIAALQNATDENLKPIWTMSYGGRVISERPREEVIAQSINQIIHHRAQLGVFLRLLDVPIPGSYGPSADDMQM